MIRQENSAFQCLTLSFAILHTPDLGNDLKNALTLEDAEIWG